MFYTGIYYKLLYKSIRYKKINILLLWRVGFQILVVMIHRCYFHFHLYFFSYTLPKNTRNHFKKVSTSAFPDICRFVTIKLYKILISVL